MAGSSVQYPTSTLLSSVAYRVQTLPRCIFASVTYDALVEVNICKEMKSLMYLTRQADCHCILTKHL